MIKIYFYIFLFIIPLVDGSQMKSIEVIGALQKFEILNSYNCGHPVKSTISFCTCDCIADVARQNHYDNSKYQNPEHRCTKNELCSEVADAYIVAKECLMFGICSLQFSPLNIYKHLHLENPKTFINIKINEDGQDVDISLPTKYKTLVYKGIGYKINCLKDSDELLSNKKGWYFIREGESQVITKTKYPQKYNEQKKVDFGKYCWYQLENKDEIQKEINNLNPLTNEVCEQNFYLPKFESIKGLYRKDNTSNEEFVLGNKIKVDFIKLSQNTVELTYSCKNVYIESVNRFVSMFASVHLKEKDVYLRRNDNFTKVEDDVSVVVLDEGGRNITEEITVVVEKLNVLHLLKEFYNFSSSIVIVCIDIKVSMNNWCERFHLMDFSELDLREINETEIESQDNVNSTIRASNTDIYRTFNALIVIGPLIIIINIVIVLYCNYKYYVESKQGTEVNDKFHEENILMRQCGTNQNLTEDISSNDGPQKLAENN